MDNLSHTIRKFNRFELKYVISLQQAERFKTELRRYLVPDDHSGANDSYSLASLYFDSPDLRCYWEKENGLKTRRKLRLRNYESDSLLTEDSLVFVEIKQRIDRVTQKRRAQLSYRDALTLCNDRLIPDHNPEDRAVLEEAFAFIWQYNLRPASIVRYSRQAYMGTEYDMGLRVTFDTNLSTAGHQLRLHESSPSLAILPPNQVVMEIKVNERIPNWLTDMIAFHNLPLTRISKYCRSIESTWNDPLFQHIGLPVESAREALASSFAVYNSPGSKIHSIKPNQALEE